MVPLRWVSINRAKFPAATPHGNRMPLERAALLAMLDDDTLYYPSTAAETGYCKSTIEYIRARKAFAFFASERGLGQEYDNVEKLSTDPAGWFGSSWKWALGSGMQRVADLMDELERIQTEHPDKTYWLDGETIIEKPHPERFLPQKAEETSAEAEQKSQLNPEFCAEPSALIPINLSARPKQKLVRRLRTGILLSALAASTVFGFWFWQAQSLFPDRTLLAKDAEMPTNQDFMGPAQ